MNTQPKLTVEEEKEFDDKFSNIISAELCIRGHYVPIKESDPRNKLKSHIALLADKRVREERERIYVDLQRVADENDCSEKEGYIQSGVVYKFLQTLNK